MSLIAIDIGGTTVKGALFCGDRIAAERALPTPGQEGRDAIFRTLFALIDGLAEDAGEGVAAIGISSAGNIHPASGVCLYATDNLMGWTGADIRGEVERRFGVPCRADNDAVCALMGELTLCPGLRDVTMLTFGTGVGGASLVNGSILRGQNFDAGRWGHVCLHPQGERCSCGKRGCAEAYLSATALLRRGRERIPALSSCKELFELAGRGVAEACAVVKAFAADLDLLLDDIRTVLAPERIILGGGVAQSAPMFLPLLQRQDDILLAQLGSRAGVYGARSLVIDYDNAKENEQ